MPKRVSERAKKALANMVENGGIVSRAMIDAGYSPNTAKSPNKLTDSAGFRMELEKLGLTKELITTSLVSDIKAKPKKRLGELSLGADILGIRKRDEEEGDKHYHLHLDMTNEQATRLLRRAFPGTRNSD